MIGTFFIQRVQFIFIDKEIITSVFKKFKKLLDFGPKYSLKSEITQKIVLITF